MRGLEFRRLEASNRLAVCSCGHFETADPRLVASRQRYLEEQEQHGLCVIVAHLAGEPAGFVQLTPLETAARDVRGEGALFVHCITVFRRGSRVGRQLVEEAARVAAGQSRGLVVDALERVYGYMPAEFFARMGFHLIQARGARRLMARGLPPGAPWPAYREPRYTFRPVQGQVVVDVYFTPLCTGRCSREPVVIRLVAREYPGKVTVRVHDCADPEVRERHGIARAVFVNGVMRPNGDLITLDEARALVEAALAREPAGCASWDDSISRLF